MYGVIYQVVNTVNGHRYIGQTITTVAKRWGKHCSDARVGAGWVLSAAIRKHGVENFSHSVVEECATKDELNAAAIRWIAALRPEYNACRGGGGLGTPSEEVRAKLRVAMQNRPAEVRDKAMAALAAARWGRPVAQATRDKLRAAFSGKRLRKAPITAMEVAQLVERNRARRKYPVRHDLIALYAEHGATTKREKIRLAALHGFEVGLRKRLMGSANPMFGVAIPPQRRAELSEQMSGEGNPYYGRVHSDETRAKMRAAHAAREPVECPHCGVQGHLNPMKRWHFDNCRSKP